MGCAHGWLALRVYGNDTWLCFCRLGGGYINSVTLTKLIRNSCFAVRQVSQCFVDIPFVKDLRVKALS